MSDLFIEFFIAPYKKIEETRKRYSILLTLAVDAENYKMYTASIKNYEIKLPFSTYSIIKNNTDFDDNVVGIAFKYQLKNLKEGNLFFLNDSGIYLKKDDSIQEKIQGKLFLTVKNQNLSKIVLILSKIYHPKTLLDIVIQNLTYEQKDILNHMKESFPHLYNKIKD